jgi:hypothetical protein
MWWMRATRPSNNNEIREASQASVALFCREGLSLRQRPGGATPSGIVTEMTKTLSQGDAANADEAAQLDDVPQQQQQQQ